MARPTPRKKSRMRWPNRPRFIGTERAEVENSPPVSTIVESFGTPSYRVPSLRFATAKLSLFLRREPRTADLNNAAVSQFLAWMEAGKFSPNTIDKVRVSLFWLARQAGVSLDGKPLIKSTRVRRSQLRTFSFAELNRLFAAARSMPGEISPHVKARHFWPAILLTILDARISAPTALELPADSFDQRALTLKLDGVRIPLNATTAAAITAVPPSRGRLFPWDFDAATLYYRFRELLYVAGMKLARGDSLSRLTRTGSQAVDLIDFAAPFVPCDLADYHPRRRPGGEGPPRPRSSAGTWPDRNGEKRKESKGQQPPPKVYQILVSECARSPSVLNFFETRYACIRLADCSPHTAESYRSTIRKLNDFAACEVTVSQLSDDLLERFLAWTAKAGYAPHTRKSMQAELLALWRWAWRKSATETQPRDIDPVKVPRLVPVGFDVDQITKLLYTAANVEGTIMGVPAGLWWTSLISVLFETGLRVSAVMNLRSEDFEPDCGFVTARWPTQKGRNDQSLSLSEDTVRLLLSTNPATREKLFEWPWRSKQTLYKRFKHLLRLAGLPCSRKYLFHSFRKSHASYVTAAFSIERAKDDLGHSTIEVTRSYIIPRLLPQSRTVDAIQRPTWRPRRLITSESED